MASAVTCDERRPVDVTSRRRRRTPFRYLYSPARRLQIGRIVFLARRVPLACAASYIRPGSHGDGYRAAQRTHATLCEGGRWRLRRDLPPDGARALSLLPAPLGGHVGGRRSPPGNDPPAPPRPPDAPGPFDCPALGAREFTRGPCRSSPV